MKARFPDKEVSPQTGAPFGMKREVLLSPIGLPCNPPPWGTLSAHRSQEPEDPLAGAARHHRGAEPAGPRPPRRHADLRRPARHRGRAGLHRRRTGRLSSRIRCEDRRRALDRPPTVDRHSTPTTYLWQGRQYVVIAAGGHGEAGARRTTRWSPSRCRGPASRPLALAALDRQAGRQVRAARRHERNRGARAGGAVVAAA